MAMLAFLAGGDWETSPAQQAGTSPAGIGGALEQFPSALFPAYPESPAAGVRAEASAKWENFRGQAPVPGLISDEPTSPQPSLPNLPTDFPGLTLPTHVDHDGALVAAAGERVRALGGSLTESEAISVLRAAGWPTELIPQALAVAWCESKWSPWAIGDSGRSVGWFQTNLQTWFSYFNEDPEQWMDAVTNARVAWRIYQYEQARGYVPFSNWSCRP